MRVSRGGGAQFRGPPPPPLEIEKQIIKKSHQSKS